MYDSHSKGISYIGGFFMLIAFAIAGIIAAGLIGEQVWTSLTGKDISVLRNNAMTAADSKAMQWIQAISAVVGFLLPSILVASMLNKKPFRLLGFNPSPTNAELGLTVVIILTAMIISIFALSYFNREIPLPADWKIRADKLEADYNHQAKTILQLNSTGDYIIALLVMGMLPAICEEALFRGGLQNFLTRSTGRPWLSIIIVSLIFSAVHASFYGFIPRLFLGGVLGIIFHYSRKLWLSILAHFINNAFGISVLYLYTRQGRSIDEAMKQENNNWWGILLVPVLVVLLSTLHRIANRNKDRHIPVS